MLLLAITSFWGRGEVKSVHLRIIEVSLSSKTPHCATVIMFPLNILCLGIELCECETPL